MMMFPCKHTQKNIKIVLLLLFFNSLDLHFWSDYKAFEG